MNLTEFIKKLAQKCEISEDILKDVFDSVKEVELPDGIGNVMHQKLMTMEGAKNNPELVKFFRHSILSGADTAINDVMSELGLDDLKTELSEEKNTFEKIKLAISKLNAMKKESKEKGESDEKIKAYSKQIQELNDELKKYKSDYIPKSELEEATKGYNEKVKSFYLDSILGKYEYSTELAKEENHLLPKTKLNKALTEGNLQLVLTDNGLTLQTLEGTEPYSKDNSKITLDSFVEGTLAKSNLLKVQNSEQPKEPAKPNEQSMKWDNSDALAMLEKQKAEMTD